jgi:Ca2+-binding EF-hand superfamily protein
MNEFRLGFDDSDIGKVFKYFDRDGSGDLSYDEFLRGIRGEMN